MQSAQSEYYLQIVKSGDNLQWPVPEEELTIGSQEIGSGYTQYWAYSKSSGKEATDLPHAEVVASEHLTHDPVVLIDQPYPATAEVKNYLELILAKDGHAFGKSESSLDNLEDNLGSILDYAKNQLGIQINHFMTTKRVSPEVETMLDKLEGGRGGNTVESEETVAVDPVPVSAPGVSSGPGDPIKTAWGADNSKLASQTPNNHSNMIKIGVIIIILAILLGGAFIFRDRISSKLNGPPQVTDEGEKQPFPTPQPSPTPTPISLDRSQLKVRVLNGTTKTGAAATLADKLKKLEWQITNTGNNSRQDIAGTLVRAKSATDSAAQVLVFDLAPDLKASISADLKKTDKADLEVVIGKE